jgi:hypothetical protein
MLERKSVSKFEASDLNQSVLSSSTLDEKVLQDVLASLYVGNALMDGYPLLVYNKF